MAAAALAARVIEVIADLGPSAEVRYRYGSGCIVGGRTVLTAAHVVAGAVTVSVRDPDRHEYLAMVDPRFVGDLDGSGPDLALLEITDPAFAGDLPLIGLAAVDRDNPVGEPVERCHAVGYPWFAETPSTTAVRDTVDAIGMIPVLAKRKTGLLSVQTTVTPRELPPEQTTLGASQWTGMSGAPVFAAGRLLGVVTEHALREGPSAIMAVPLTALQADPAHKGWGPGVADPAAWWSRLGAAGIGDLQMLPPPPPPREPPPYRSTLRDFGRALHQRMPQLVGREQELSQIVAFATGGERYRWLVGGAFTGKTALMYEAATVGLPDEVDVVSYFLSRRASDASCGRFLTAVVPQLAYLCNVDAPDANVDQYRALWEQAAGRAERTGRHLLLAVDGLDEDLRPPRSPSVASLLPALAGSHVHVLVTSRRRPDLPGDVPEEHPLVSVTPVHLDPFAGAQELADLAKMEIYDLTHGDDSDLAVDVLGMLTAAEGPLSLRDLVMLQSDMLGTPAAANTTHVRRLVEEHAARSLERVGPAGNDGYQFAHASLLEYARTMPDLCDPEYRQRIHWWAIQWRNLGWPIPGSGREGTPRYLLDTYAATLAHDPQRLAQLATDIGWVEAAVVSAGVGLVLDDLRRAAAANPAGNRVSAVLAAITRQNHNLRSGQPLNQPGYILRQLWMQAAELTEDDLADRIRSRLRSRQSPDLVPQWTTRRANLAFLGELGRHDTTAGAVAVLPDGRVVTGGKDGRVLAWDPQTPGAGPAEIGRHDDVVKAIAVLPDGRVVTSASYGRILVWDPEAPGTGPAEIGRHRDWVTAMAVLPDGRVVTGGEDGRVLAWDPQTPGTGPAAIGRHRGWVTAMTALPDGRVVTGRPDGQILVWDPRAPGTGPAAIGDHRGWVTAMAVLPDGRVVTGGEDGRVLALDPDAPGTGPAEIGHDRYGVTAVAVLPDGRVVTGGRDGRVLAWDPDAPGTRAAEIGPHSDWMTVTVTVMVVLPDGRVVTGGDDGRVVAWNTDAPNPAVTDRYGDMIKAVAVLPDGRVVTGSLNGRVLAWDPDAPGTGPAKIGRHGDGIKVMAALPDGRVVTGGFDGRVLAWDPDAPGTGPAKIGRHRGHWVTAVAVLPDGRVVTGGHDGRVLAWDPQAPGTGPAKVGRHGDGVTAMTVLPDGRVVTGGEDGRVLAWDPQAPGTRPVELGRHRLCVMAAATLPDGRAVTGGIDERVLVWDPDAPGTGPTEIGRHGDLVAAVALLPDGRVVSGGGNEVLVWDPAGTRTHAVRLTCSVAALATSPPNSVTSQLAIAHEDNGFSLWSVMDDPAIYS